MRPSPFGLLSLSVFLLLTVPRNARSQAPPLRQDYLQALHLAGQKKYGAAIDSLKVIISADSSFFPAYLKIVELASYQRALDQCERYFKEALTTSPNNPFLHHALGLIYRHRKRWRPAYQHILRALQLDFNYAPAYRDFVDVNRTPAEAETMFKELLAAKPDIAAAHLGLAYIYSLQLDRKKEIECAARALQLQPHSLEAQYYLAEGHYWSGDLQKAIKECAAALKVAKQRRDPDLEIDFLNLHSFIENKLGKTAAAIHDLEAARALAQKIGSKQKLSDTLNSMARIHWYLEDFRRAESYAQQALAIDTTLGDKAGVASNLGYIGIMNFNLGNYSKGLDYYYRAKDIYEQLNDKSGIAVCTGNIASGQLKLGDYEKTIAFASRAIGRFTELGSGWQKPLANYLRVRGMAHKALGQFQEALSDYQRSLGILQGLRTEGHQIGTTLTLIGDLYRERSDYEQAFDYYKRALKSQPLIWKRRTTEETRLSLASLYVATRRYEEAKEAFTRVRTYGLKVGSPELLWKAEAGLASVYRAQGKLEEAIKHFTRAIDHIEFIRSNFRTAEEASGFLSDKFGVYSGLVAALYATHEKAPVAGYDSRAFAVAERGKAEILLDFLSRGRIFDYLEGMAPELKQEYMLTEQDIEKKHTALSDELLKGANERDPASVAALKDSLDLLQQKKVRIFDEIEQRYPQAYRLTNPRLVPVAELQRDVVSADEVLVEYLVGEEKTYLWAITRDRFLFRAIPLSKEQLKKKLASISPLFSQTKKAIPAKVDHRWANIKTSGLHELYDILLRRPLQGVLKKGMSLVIVPDDVLHYFPFEILVSAYSGETIRYLVDDFPVSYISSASLLTPERSETKHAPETLLAFANPSLENEPERGMVDWVHALIPTKAILRMEQFVPLPFAEEEVKAIAGNFSKSAIYLHEDATESAFKRQAPDYKIIHLATHNIADDQQPLYSKVVFAQPDPGKEDGFLQTYEVFNLNLQADLVVLSGCSTGLGKLRRGEGLIGMTRAFLYAGASSLMVSLWPVDDRSTSELMRAFYANLKQGMPLSRALQHAKQRLLHAPDARSNPFYWGPFVLIGDSWRAGGGKR